MLHHRVMYKAVALALVSLFMLTSTTLGQIGGPYSVSLWTIDNGGGLRTGSNYTLDGTVGQPDTGSFSGGLYTLIGGFWAFTAAKPPADPVDLMAQKLEVTQGVQDLNNSVRLVAHKRTFVRFHVRANNGVYRTFAQLRVQSNGKPDIWLSPVNVDRGHINVRVNPNRAALNDAFLFELPSSYTEGAVTLTGEVNPLTPWRLREPAEQDVNNNSVATTLTFENVPTVNLVVYGVGYGNPQSPILPAQLHYDHLSDWLRQVYPVSNLRIQQRTLTINVAQFAYGDCWNVINPRLESIRLQDLANGRIPAGAHYYGMVDDRSAIFNPSCAFGIPAMVASGATGTPNPDRYRSGWDKDQSYGDWLGGHELGHDYGRRHTLSSRNTLCPGGEGGPDPNYPHPNARISPTLTGDSAIYGFNIDKHEIYGPEWHDVMSYCEYLWISDYTYEALMDYFQRNPVVTSANQRSNEQTDRLLVTGAIDPQTSQVKLQPLFVLSNAGDVQPRTPGDYAIVLRSAVGAELARYPFTPVEGETYSDQLQAATDELHPLLIAELVPFVAGTAKVEIEKGDSVLASVAAGIGKPTITLTNHNSGGTLSDKVITLSWDASDPDGDPLTFIVQYSPDGGQSWQTVAQNIQGNSTTLDVSTLEGGNAALFQVLASDGINTASDQSDATFNVANHVPTVKITQSATNLTIAVSQTLALAGNAYDLDTGTMDDSQLRWTSNLNGFLGTGAQLSTASLSLGTHTITFQADDGVGGVATATIQVTVVSDPTQLPTVPDALQVGPAQLMLNPATNTISATLSIVNQNGLSAIYWSATADQAWVQLSKATGATPDAIVVTVSPAALAQGANTTVITLISPQVPGQSVTVQVLAQNGEPDGELNNKVYLPVVSK